MTDTTNPSPDIAKQLRLLREDYARQLPGKLALIEQAFSNRDSEESALHTLRFLAHSLAGSGTTFGFPELSDISQQIEIVVDVALDAKRPLIEIESKDIGDLIHMLRKIALKPAEPMPSPTVPRLMPPGAAKKLIYLIDDDTSLAAETALQLSHFGFRVCTFESPDRLNCAIAEPNLAAIIMDIVFPEGDLAGAEIVMKLSLAERLKAPVIFTSVRGDLPARLAAVRAGAASYITKPVDVRSLVKVLDNITSDQMPEPYRVLIVDDTEQLAGHYAFTLQAAGILTDVVTDPMRMLIHLTDFRPDLVLMDMYMPGCTGAELASIIRQLEDYISVPIVFLSTERDRMKQLNAMQLGGDDFLTKPISTEHVVAAISARLRRYRVLRAHMDQDSLTGLLNHGTTRKHLAVEVSRAIRQNLPFCFAMIDLDHFKKVNDSYGHPIGDQVLKSLAELLKQRLRKSDIIGRVGGEEFAVILPHTNGSDAVAVLDKLRESFSGVCHRAEGVEFTATFSCGIAEYRRGASADAVNALADQALYQAKQRGRNQIVMSEFSNIAE